MNLILVSTITHKMWHFSKFAKLKVPANKSVVNAMEAESNVWCTVGNTALNTCNATTYTYEVGGEKISDPSIKLIFVNVRHILKSVSQIPPPSYCTCTGSWRNTATMK